jgi:hypothetical protein
MKRFGKTVVKNWFVDELKDFIKSINFKIGNDSGHKAFIQNTDYWLLSCYIEASYDIKGNELVDTLYFSNAIVRIHKVETLLGKIIGDSSYVEAGKTFSLITPKQFGEKLMRIEKKEDVQQLAKIFKKVFSEYFLPAFERYSDPKNVLELWDSLETSKEKGRYFQDSNNYSKIIILSKISNDLRYEQRVQEAIEFYENKIKNGEEYYREELSYCKKVIDYLANSVLLDK